MRKNGLGKKRECNPIKFGEQRIIEGGNALRRVELLIVDWLQCRSGMYETLLGYNIPTVADLANYTMSSVPGYSMSATKMVPFRSPLQSWLESLKCQIPSSEAWPPSIGSSSAGCLGRPGHPSPQNVMMHLWFFYIYRFVDWLHQRVGWTMCVPPEFIK